MSASGSLARFWEAINLAKEAGQDFLRHVCTVSVVL